MRLREGVGFGLKVVSGVLFAQLIIAVINPPTDRWAYLIFVSVIDVAVLLTTAAAFARWHRRDEQQRR